MERAGQDEPRGERAPDHHKLDIDREQNRSDEVSTPKRRTRRALWAGGITILMIATAAVGVVAFSRGKVATSDSAIPVGQAAVFRAPPSLEPAVLEGWYVSENNERLTTVRNDELRCYFKVRQLAINTTKSLEEDRIIGDIAATEGKLSGISNAIMLRVNNMRQVGHLKKLSVPQASLEGPGLEFITMRLDYSNPGTGRTTTVRIGARSMPSSGATLTAVLLCPTSLVEDGKDPWPTLMANTTVVAGE